MADNPMLAGRSEALLRELARPAVRPDGTEYSGEECLEYAADFMRTTAVPQDLVFPTLSLVGEAAVETDIGRIEDQAVVDHVEATMQTDPDGWFRAPAPVEAFEPFDASLGVALAEQELHRRGTACSFVAGTLNSATAFSIAVASSGASTVPNHMALAATL
jgi:hypothetical protein